MARILRNYAIREIIHPTLITLLAITFILLIGRIFDFVNLMMQPGVSALQVLGVLGLLLPQIAVFALPMAILIGTMIGIGRLALDREVLAMRASGINMFNIFVAMMIGVLFLSAFVSYLEATVIPRTLLAGMRGFAELEFKIVNSLEPGRFYKKLGGGDSDFILYFTGRDDKTHNMTGVVVRLDSDFQVGGATASTAKKKKKTDDEKTTGTMVSRLSDGTTITLPRLSPAEYVRQGVTATTDSLGNITPLDEDGKPIPADESSTVFFAQSGTISSDFSGGDDPTGEMVLELFNGTSHRLATDKSQEYALSSFARMRKVFTLSSAMSSLKDELKTRTNTELRTILRDTSAAGKKSSTQGEARRELVRRYAFSLASFVFIFIGIPLAIYARPSGKSWGILIAVALMFAYYAMMQFGLSMVKGNLGLGLAIAFAPNLLYLLLGCALWWRTLRS